MISNGPEEEIGFSGKPFLLSDYKDGFFHPSGDFSPEPIMSPGAIKKWEDANSLWEGKAWGVGQALFFKGRPLVFGRDDLDPSVDVLVSVDPESDGNYRNEFSVSRRHFELQPPLDSTIIIKDLGSRNGIRIYNRDMTRIVLLDKSNPNGILKEGDFTLFGGGGSDLDHPERTGRLIGFRVCRDVNNKLFLVKFNAENLDDLLSLIGKTRTEKELSSEEAIDLAYRVLLADMKELTVLIVRPENSRVPELLSAYQKLFSDLFRLSGEIGRKFCNNDWNSAAALIGRRALEEAQKQYEQGNKENVGSATELSFLALDLAQNRIVKFLNIPKQ